MKKILENLLRLPRTIILIYILISCISLVFTIQNLIINTSTDSLIDERLEFKVNQKELKESFSVLNNNILIRIKTSVSGKAKEIGKKILKDLKKKEGISFFYSPNLDLFFKENFFLFMNETEKQNLVEKLYEYQPFLSELNNNKSKLSGFNNLLELSLKENSDNSLEKFKNIFENFTVTLNTKTDLDWSNVLSTGNDECFIILGLKKDYLNVHGFDDFYRFLLKLKKFESPNLNIDFTGGLIIDYEEISSVSSGALYSGLLSFFLVGIILWVAFKNFLVIVSLLFTIVLGLLITLGLTTALIGSLNLISVAFAVLFIGLSVDYGIQVCSRIVENNALGSKSIKDIITKIDSVTKTLLIASIPSVIGFLSFLTTSYVGLAELGLISSIGLVVGFIMNVTLLPSLIMIFSKKINYKFFNISFERYTSTLFKNRNLIISFFLLLFIFSSAFFKEIDFDFDALNLKDQKLQSVRLAKEIIEKNPTSDYVISIILDEKQISEFDDSHEIFKDENVKSFFTYEKIFKSYQLDDLEYLKFLLSQSNAKNMKTQNNQIERLELLLDKLIKKDVIGVSNSAQSLMNAIKDAYEVEISSKEMEKLLFGRFNDLILLINNLGKRPENLSNSIPPYFIQRYVSENGLYRVEIFPSKDLSKPENLENFVNAVEVFFPNASGMPVIQYKAGRVVVDSFLQVLGISLTFLIIFLFIIFRRLKPVVLCISSLFCAFILTVFFMIILNIKLNFANMIALPLLFSLGICYPIYFLKRFEELNDLKKVFDSNTPLAIIFSGLTTIFSFSTLSLSSHQGTSSMGILLLISLSMTLVSSLTFLPLIMKLSTSK